MACELCDRTFGGDVVHDAADGLVVVHDDWAVRGHVMVVASRHVQNVSDLPAQEWDALSRLYHRAESALLQLTGADRAIVMKLGIATPHLHLHIYPVTERDDRAAVMAAIDGKTRVPRDEAFVQDLRRLLA